MFDYSIVGYLMGKTPVTNNQETEPLKNDQDEEESKDETEDIVYKPVDL